MVKNQPPPMQQSSDKHDENHDWPKLEEDVERLFSAAPLLPGAVPERIGQENLYLGRTAEARLLIKAVRDPAKHILLFGERGIGKTSLANVFTRDHNTVNDPISTCRVQAYPSDDFSSLWSRALTELRSVLRHSVSDISSDHDTLSPDIVLRAFRNIRSPTVIIIDEFDLLRDRGARELTANLLKSLHDCLSR